MSLRFVCQSLAAFSTLALTTAARADVFFAPDQTANIVQRINAVGAASTFVSDQLVDPVQAITTPAGDMVVADNGAGKVFSFAAGSDTAQQIGDSAPGILSLAFDPNGVLYISNSSREIRKLVGITFQLVTTLQTGATPRSIAFDSTGDLYVADQTGGNIVLLPLKNTPQNPTPKYYAVGNAPYAVAFDSTGKLYFTDSGSNGRIATAKVNPNNSGALSVSQ